MSTAEGTVPIPPAPPGRTPEGRQRVPVGAIILVVLGALLSLGALAPLGIGTALVWAHTTQRDVDGFYTTSQERFETTSYAITSDEIDLGGGPSDERFLDLGDIATVRLQVESAAEKSIFVGIAQRDDVARFLSGVGYAEIDDVRFDPFAVDYRYQQGDGPETRPGQADIWVASAEGPGRQTLEWELESGRWAVVVMNADASPGVSVNAAAGVKATWVLPLGVVLLVAGGLMLIVGAVLVVIGVVALARGTHIDLAAAQPPSDQPVRLGGRRDPSLNRWLWLVKWVLLIPHFIVLAVLWLVFSVVTVVAFFAILFTERYPRALFEFNAGVLRWTWRVAFYGYSALGTDRYPPFSLGPEPDYPATLEIAYPERLSRGLVLIKWWLLAIPHYLVLGIIGGGVFLGFEPRFAAAGVFGGLIGLLVVFAGVGLLFTGIYPRGIFDFVLGLDRWVYRVIVYVTLLRDEYPPFRLDQGATEPVPPPSPPPPETSGTAIDEPQTETSPV
jgi:hypothetical protein